MPLAFNSADSPFYSETERTWATPANWTVNGVNMTRVKKTFIGVGNGNNPVADGTGMLFIDDIRVIAR